MLAFFATLISGPALASEGIPVAIAVTDEQGEPIKSAVIRHVDEKARHRVNMETGVWEGEAIYLMDGTEVLFDKNMLLKFEVSAPGYQMTPVTYQVKKRKNLVPVILKKLEIEIEEDEEEMGAGIQFKRDLPRD